MGLRTKVHVVTADGRDKHKRFLLTEMPAMQTEKWAWRAFLAMARAGVEVPDDIRNAGVAGIAIMGFQALQRVAFDDLEPLLDEMMGCIAVIRDPKHPDVTQPLMDGDIEEVKTILELRWEVFELHVGFSVADVLSKSRLASAKPSTDSPNTSTSPAPSEQSSPAAAPA